MLEKLKIIVQLDISNSDKIILCVWFLHYIVATQHNPMLCNNSPSLHITVFYTFTLESNKI